MTLNAASRIVAIQGASSNVVKEINTVDALKKFAESHNLDFDENAPFQALIINNGSSEIQILHFLDYNYVHEKLYYRSRG